MTPFRVNQGGLAAPKGLSRRSASPTRAKRGGFTLVEIGLAMTVLMVALMAMSASTLRSHSLRRQNRERAVAQNAIRQVSEEIHALSDQIRRTTAGSWSRDLVTALSPGGSLGDRFEVRELNPREGSASVGSITVVLDESLSDADLGLELGMPRDLDGDGLTDNADVGDGARILPIIVRARWKGVSGDVQLTHPFYVIGY
jgi:type II secretory pathway pseudopilin PulG